MCLMLDNCCVKSLQLCNPERTALFSVEVCCQQAIKQMIGVVKFWRNTEQQKRILLMDRATTHTAQTMGKEVMRYGLLTRRFGNILIVFFPAGATAVVQPMDAGIIKAARQRLVHHKIQADAAAQQPAQACTAAKSAELQISSTLMQFPKLSSSHLHALAGCAWNDVPAYVIKAAWVKSRILPQDWTEELALESSNAAKLERDYMQSVQRMTADKSGHQMVI